MDKITSENSEVVTHARPTEKYWKVLSLFSRPAFAPCWGFNNWQKGWAWAWEGPEGEGERPAGSAGFLFLHPRKVHFHQQLGPCPYLHASRWALLGCWVL